MTRGPGPRAARALLSLAALAAVPGCGVKRVLAVESRPPGARVWVNGVERGTTPLRVPYVHDGLFTLRLEMQGYESVADEVRTVTAADALPGVDFFAENFSRPRERVTTASYDLVPLQRTSYTDAELAEIVRRANEFRARTERETTAPDAPQPTRPPRNASETPPAAR